MAGGHPFILWCIVFLGRPILVTGTAAADCPVQEPCSCIWGFITLTDAVTGCTSCKCKPKKCAPLDCDERCLFGHEVDAGGCPICECRSASCRQSKCPGGHPICLDNYVIKRECETCRCRTFQCNHLRPERCDFVSCPEGTHRFVNEYGCHTCDCVPDCHEDEITSWCSLDCELGFKTDEWGCNLCECKPLVVCPEVHCDTCHYGRYYTKNGCQSQTCLCLGQTPGMVGE